MKALVSGLRHDCMEEIAYWYRSHPGSATLHGGQQIGLAFAEEHRSMAESLLCDDRLMASHRRWLKRFHALENARAMVRAVLSGEIQRSVGLFWRGFLVGFLWPLIAIKELTVLWIRRLRVL